MVVRESSKIFARTVVGAALEVEGLRAMVGVMASKMGIIAS